MFLMAKTRRDIEVIANIDLTIIPTTVLYELNNFSGNKDSQKNMAKKMLIISIKIERYAISWKEETFVFLSRIYFVNKEKHDFDKHEQNIKNNPLYKSNDSVLSVISND